jgi:hypothetical protein
MMPGNRLTFRSASLLIVDSLDRLCRPDVDRSTMVLAAGSGRADFSCLIL